MELYVIESMHSETPLAEIRTDGRNIDWILDNTEGKLPGLADGDFARLKSVVDKSSHLSMKTPEEATVGLLRYSLANGDIVEITTDGKSAMLNGKMMPEEEKHALMAAVNSGKIKVKGKANITRPMPMARRPKPAKKPAPQRGIDPHMMAAIAKKQEEDDNKESMNNAHRDSKIDSVDFSDSECPEMGRQLLYLLKYGDTHA